MESDDVQIMDIRGLSFKRFLEIAKITGAKVAVITDNDSDHKKNCVYKYKDFAKDKNISVFYETDDSKWTFEVVLEADNSALCNRLFGLNAVEYMLNNKTEAAFNLMNESSITVSDYIKRAIEWIRS